MKTNGSESILKYNPRIALTINPKQISPWGNALINAFEQANCEVKFADYTDMMKSISKQDFGSAYASSKRRAELFAHAKARAAEILDEADCLALSGNPEMIDPILFGKPRDKTQSYNLERTIAELALVHVATQRGMPIYGVCGGHQVIAVYGGSTVSPLTDDELKHNKMCKYDQIILNTDSLLFQIMQPEPGKTKHKKINVFGAHKQVVRSVRKGFTHVAGGAEDATIEATESEHGSPVITTQFHPEVMCLGLGENSVYKGTQRQAKMSQEIFKFFHDAGESYHNKMIVMEKINKRRIPSKKTHINKLNEIKKNPQYTEENNSNYLEYVPLLVFTIMSILSVTLLVIYFPLVALPPLAIGLAIGVCFGMGFISAEVAEYIIHFMTNNAEQTPKPEENQDIPEKIMTDIASELYSKDKHIDASLRPLLINRIKKMGEDTVILEQLEEKMSSVSEKKECDDKDDSFETKHNRP